MTKDHILNCCKHKHATEFLLISLASNRNWVTDKRYKTYWNLIKKAIKMFISSFELLINFNVFSFDFL